MSRTTVIEERFADATLNLALDTIGKGKQALVFCNTKRGAESQAEKIAQKIKEPKNADLLNVLADRALKAVSSPTKQCKRLAMCLKGGIAFHHAGLHSQQRELVETAFRDGTLSVICATPTLAMGMDLPAFRSIIRDLKRYSQGTSWGMSDIPVLEYEQMCVSGDTAIRTSVGDIPIREIVESKDEFSILTYDTMTAQYSYQPLVAKYRTSAKNILTIRLQRGYALGVTSEHPLYVRRAGMSMWRAAGTLNIGDELLLTTTCAVDANETVISLLLPEQGVYLPNGSLALQQCKQERGWSNRQIGELINTEKKNIYHYKHGKKALPLRKGVQLHESLETPSAVPPYFSTIKSRYGSVINVEYLFHEDFFWLVGILATDGTLTTTTDRRTKSRYVKVRVANTNKDIITKAKGILEKLTEGTTYCCRREDGLWQLEKGCTLLADILRSNFGIPHGAKSHTVRAPPWLLRAPLAFVGAYLAGVFDGDGSYLPGRRVHFATGSVKFASDIQALLLRLGVGSTVLKEKAGQTVVIKGKRVTFKEGVYAVKITKKSSLMKLAKFVTPVKCKIAESYSRYNNIHTFHDNGKEEEFLKITTIVSRSCTEPVYNLGVAVNNNYFANGILAHNCGRAGRPGKETAGEAVCIAATKDEEERIIDHYVRGDPEDIYSKLAVEPVLRTYVLSLIASGYVQSMESLERFFGDTFYAFQYGDMSKIQSQLGRMVQMLAEWGFLDAPAVAKGDFVVASDVVNGTLRATKIGERVAQLYLDPLTAHELLTALERAAENKLRPTPFALLHLVANTLELRPLFNVRQGEIDMLDKTLVAIEKELFVPGPSIYSAEYEEFLQTVKTAVVLRDWIEEVGEDTLLEGYNVAPGDLHAKRDRADWILHSLSELVKLRGMPALVNELEKLRVRLEHGAKEELLALLRLKGVGRVRGRALYKNGIRTLDDLRSAEVSALRALVGNALAIDLKDQVGIKVAPEDVQVKANKRKGQIALGDYDGK